MDAPTPPAEPQPAPPRVRLGRLSIAAWETAEPRVLGFVLKVLATAAGVASAPLFLLSGLLLILDVPSWWALVPAAVGALLLIAGVGAYLVVRDRLKRLKRFIETASSFEEVAFGAP